MVAAGSIITGLALAAAGYMGRHTLRSWKVWKSVAPKQLQSLLANFANSQYYKGGFELRMTRREAGLILGISPSSSKTKLKEAHKRTMLANHPDRGGSPYLAAKINAAKDVLHKN